MKAMNKKQIFTKPFTTNEVDHMKYECAICSQNKPFDIPEEIVDAAIKGDLVVFCGAGISTEGKMFYHTHFIRLLEMS